MSNYDKNWWMWRTCTHTQKKIRTMKWFLLEFDSFKVRKSVRCLCTSGLDTHCHPVWHKLSSKMLFSRIFCFINSNCQAKATTFQDSCNRFPIVFEICSGREIRSPSWPRKCSIILKISHSNRELFCWKVSPEWCKRNGNKTGSRMCPTNDYKSASAIKGNGTS